MKTNLKVIVCFFLFLFAGCSIRENRKNVIIGINADISTFNPAFAMTMTEGNISELLYLSLVGNKWDETKGELVPYPLLAEKWEWAKDSSFVDITINDKAKWSDGQDITSYDVLFTFDIYSDPAVNSKFFDSFDYFDLNKDHSIDLKKVFKVLSNKEIRINFKKGSIPSTVYFDLPLIPKHIFEKVERKNLFNSELNQTAVTSGPYVLQEWNKNQFIKLALNKNSFLAEPGSIAEIIFKVIPDYNSSIIQLDKGDIDFAEELKFEDINKLKTNRNLNIFTIKGRDYDYLGLNNLDPIKFEKKLLEPNPFFGDSLTRKAIAYAIDRDMIISDYLGSYGKAAVTPVAPIFNSLIDTTIKPYTYSPKTASALLSKAGWKVNKGGILERNGKSFSFKLAIPGTNKLRNEIATIIKDNLKLVGIEVEIVPIEPSVFFAGLNDKKFDAFLAGWTVPIPIDLKPYWGSNLIQNGGNNIGYRSKNADLLLDKMKVKLSEKRKKQIYYDFEKVMYNEAPVVFLYWGDKIVVCSKRISNTDFSPLGTVHYCWKWRITE